MKTVNTSQAYSVLGISENCVLSKSGSISFVYILRMPPYLSYSSDDIMIFHNQFLDAFKNLGNAIVHRQDFYIKSFFDSGLIHGNSFLQSAAKRHFANREFVENTSVLSFTIRGLQSLEKAYVKNPISYKKELSIEDVKRINRFNEELKSGIDKINSLKGIDVVPAERNAIAEIVLSYSNCMFPDGILRDIYFAENIEVNGRKGRFLSVCDETHLPEEVSSFKVDEPTKSGDTALYVSLMEDLGIQLNCNHIVNQIWIFRNKDFEEKLNKSILQHRQYSGFDKTLKYKADILEESQKQLIENSERICQYHQNILYFADNDQELEHLTDNIRQIYSVRGFSVYQPAYEYLYNLFIGNMIGREVKLKDDFFFLTTLGASLRLNTIYTSFRGDAEGILFNDRIFQIPIHMDIWDERKKRVPARNAMIIASTGSGKSVNALNIVQQLIESDVKIIVVEFGKSFYQLCQLYPDKSFHVDYDTSKPLGINPFLLNDSVKKNMNDKEYYSKIKTLTNMVFKFWRVKDIKDDTSQEVSLRTIIHSYYQEVISDYSFPSFYEYVKVHGLRVMEENNIEPEYFDINSFLHVCREFLPGGVYQSICLPSDLEQQFEKKDFIVFELTRVKNDPFLISVIMSILYDTIENKILSDRSQKGILFFDEYAETAQLKDNQNENDIHSTVAFCYQKLRKENGAIYTIVQSPSQLPQDHNTRNIISNTQILYVLPTTEVVYSDVIDLFKIKNNNHIALMKSLNNNFSGSRPYSEIFLRFQDREAHVVRLELPGEKFLAFQTEGEISQRLNEMVEQGYSLEEAIKYYQQNN